MLHALVEGAPFPIAVLDLDGRYVFVNAAVAAMTQLRPEEHVGRLVDEIVPDVAPRLHAMIADALERGAPFTEPASFGSDTPTHATTSFPIRCGGRTLVVFVVAPIARGELVSRWQRRFAFEALLSSWASRLLAASADTIDGEITSAIGAIAGSQGFPRAAIVRFDSPDDPVAVIHEWHATDLDSLAPAVQGITVRSAGHFGEALLRGEAVSLTREALPESASGLARLLDDYSIGGFLVLPLTIDGEIRGCSAFEMPAGAGHSKEAERKLRLLSDVLATAVMRGAAERAQRAAYDEIARLKTALEQERDYLREEIALEHGGHEIVGTSAAMRHVLDLVRAVARTPAAVLVRGESGVGKELVARAIHSASDRADKPLVRVNCASIPRELFESEFFGHVRGAFTGAVKDRMGRFELADGGTIFLDEVGEIPLSEQSKLLRVLQEGELERVGDDRTRRVDVRIVAATNRRLERDVAEGRFRRDLYFRLNVFPIEVPPLRARKEDILPLAEHFLRMHQARHGRRGLSLTDEDRALLLGYGWPGNVRELAHAVERAVILSPSAPLRIDLPEPLPFASMKPPPGSVRAAAGAVAPSPPVARSVDDLRRLEVEMIRDALDASGGRISGKGGAAERLGLSPSTLRDRIKALGIRRPA